MKVRIHLLVFATIITVLLLVPMGAALSRRHAMQMADLYCSDFSYVLGNPYEDPATGGYQIPLHSGDNFGPVSENIFMPTAEDVSRFLNGATAGERVCYTRDPTTATLWSYNIYDYLMLKVKN